jgi:putative transposase
VRRYFRFHLNLRDIEELLFERGVIVSHETVRRGLRTSRQGARRKPGSTWHLDEVFVTLRGESYLLWRAIDQHGAEPDILLQKRRDKAAAKRFFKLVLVACPEVPRKIVTASCAAIRPQRPRYPNSPPSNTCFVKASARVNNRAAENNHQPTPEHGRRKRGFLIPERTQALLSSFGPIRRHFALEQHLPRARRTLCRLASLY